MTNQGAREREERTMKPKWTNGKWELFNKRGIVAILSGGKKEIVHWSGFDASDFQEQIVANARLMAASPKLYEALERICIEAESWHSVHGHGSSSVQCDSICQLIPEMRRALNSAHERAR